MTRAAVLSVIFVLIAAVIVVVACANDRSPLHVFLVAMAAWAIALGVALETDRAVRVRRRRRALRRHPLIGGGTR